MCFYSNQHAQGPGPWLLLQCKFDVVISLRNSFGGGEGEREGEQHNSRPLHFPQSFPLCFSPCLMQCQVKSTHHHTSFKRFAQASLLIFPHPNPPAFNRQLCKAFTLNTSAVPCKTFFPSWNKFRLIPQFLQEVSKVPKHYSCAHVSQHRAPFSFT